MADQNGFADWGGYMEAKMTKLDEQFAAASAPFRKSNLFAGISIFVNGLTNPSSDELKRIMSVHGGIFHHYERSYTTYIIASNLPDVKVRNMDTSKIISAQWVVDCIAAGRILDYTKYLLYTNQKTSQPRLNFYKSKKDEPPDKSKNEELDTIKQELAELNVKILQSKTENGKIKNTEDQKPKESSSFVKEHMPEPMKSSNAISTTARTAVDPKFLPEFYSNSRLHHIATLGADLKQFVTELREKHDETFPARKMLRETLMASVIADYEMIRCPLIMHIDMDCFFVSVGLRSHPHLRGQPVAVTHSKGGPGAADVPVHPKANREAEMELFAKRFEQHLHNNILSEKVRNGFDAKMSLSEIASCSYEARSKGIRNGMFVGHAIKLCPELKTIPYDFDGYKKVAYTLYETIAQYTLRIEAVSCDEMFVDITDVVNELKVAPMDFVEAVRNEVRKKTGCPCSAGIGANKLQARLATRRAKPDGQYYLESDHVEEYIAKIPAVDLPGVGNSANYTLKQAGYTTCGDLQKLTLQKLQNLLGKKTGETLYQFCRGIDNRSLNYEQVRKSVSAEVNYGIRFKEESEVVNFLRQLCGEVHSRLCQIKRKTKCVTLKIMIRAADAPVETSKFMGHGVCDYINKSETLNNFTNDLEIITRSVLTIMKNLNKPPQELRGIGIQLTKLDQPSDQESRTTKNNSIKDMLSKWKEKTKPPLKDHGETDENESKCNIKQAVPIIETVDTQKPMTCKRPNVLSMLQQAKVKKYDEHIINNHDQVLDYALTCTSDDLDSENLPDFIDREVFAALPIDIRREIIKDSRAQLSVENKITTNNKSDNNKHKLASTETSSETNILETILKEKTKGHLEYEQELDYTPSTSRAAKEREERQRQQQQQLKAVETYPPNPHQIDPNFLEALPTHIRAEIEADMVNATKRSKTIENEKEKSFVEPPRIPPENISTNNDTEPTKPENIFMHPDIKQLFLQWTKTEVQPAPADINLCCHYARDMVPNNIHILYDALVYLRKIVERKRSLTDDIEIANSWLNAYSVIARAATEACEIHFPGRVLLTRDIRSSTEPN